jgi:hypothetical protein
VHSVDGLALLTANTGYDSAAVNCGTLPRDLNTALDGARPVVGSYGRRDPLNRGATHKPDAALDKAGIEHGTDTCRPRPPTARRISHLKRDAAAAGS